MHTSTFPFIINSCSRSLILSPRSSTSATTKRNKTKQNETKRNETKRNETKRNETKRNETKRNETNKTHSEFRRHASLVLRSRRRRPPERDGRLQGRQQPRHRNAPDAQRHRRTVPDVRGGRHPVRGRVAVRTRLRMRRTDRSGSPCA